MRPMFSAATLALGAVCLAGCSVFGVRSGYEQPSYQVVDPVAEGLEVRRYGTRTAAQVVLDSDDPEATDNAAFRILAGYIFGGNQSDESIDMTSPVAVAEGEKIAMTAPVETAGGDDDAYAMRFFLPAAYSAADAPAPNDPRVEIVDVAPTTVAVLRFSGLAGDTKIADRRRELLAGLEGSDWKPVGSPVSLFYDPPWTLPFLRRSEVAVAVFRQAS